MKPRVLLFFSTLAIFFAQIAYGSTEIDLSKSVTNNDQLPFITHHGSADMDNALAMNIQYAPVKAVREQLSAYLQFKLHYFTGWNANGEAHVTVITPPEYANVIKQYVSMARIEELAKQADIQHAVVDIIGIGSGDVKINGKQEQTYFLIVSSTRIE